jgi:hypothetical protein
MLHRSNHPSLPTIGWREWLALPELGIRRIKAKVDTGARSSALHAYDMEYFTEQGGRWVKFKVHPVQRNSRIVRACQAQVVDMRNVTSSGGHTTRRPVIITDVELLGQRWQVEITLIARDEMGFRMLLGRQAVRDHFLVDPGRSFAAAKRRDRSTRDR